MAKKRKAILDLPLKLIFTEEGVSFFMKNNKRLNRFKMADDKEAYGISMDTFSPASVQRMMLINYISNIELSRAEFISKRQEIMDLSKLIVYGVLYRQLDEIVFDQVIHSDLIIQWNRVNPGNIIDEKTRLNDNYLRTILEKSQNVVHDIKKEILEPFFRTIKQSDKLSPDEKNIQLFLSEKYLNNLRPFTWFILSRFKDSTEYLALLVEIRNSLYSFMEKARIAEYLSLMIMELAINAENTNVQKFAKKKYKGSVDTQLLMFDQEMREKILSEMRMSGDNVTLSWKMGGKSGSIGTRNRLEVTIYDKAEFKTMKQSVDDKKDANMRKKSLTDFYGDLPDGQNNELGMYYLSYLSEECSKVDVRFESLVNQIRDTDLTVITMKLSF